MYITWLLVLPNLPKPEAAPAPRSPVHPATVSDVSPTLRYGTWYVLFLRLFAAKGYPSTNRFFSCARSQDCPLHFCWSRYRLITLLEGHGLGNGRRGFSGLLSDALRVGIGLLGERQSDRRCRDKRGTSAS